VAKGHPEIFQSLPGDYFNEISTVWLGLFPRDCNRVVTRKDSDGANEILAKQAVRNWLVSMPAPSRSPEEWEEGWQICEVKKVVPESNVHLPVPFPLWVSQDRTPVCVPGLTNGGGVW
jgi:hypothetical protein